MNIKVLFQKLYSDISNVVFVIFDFKYAWLQLLR